jgi:hypothetical protein
VRFIAILLIVSMSGCAILEKPETFAACKALDVATTAVALNSGGFHEVNPILRGLGIGPHVSGLLPLVGVSMLVIALIKYLNEPTVTTVASVATCGVAGHNAFLLLK